MSLPQHIAFIPDGNRRWAKERGLPSFLGHREGAKNGEKVLLSALENNIPNVTFWGTSVDNVVKRDQEEVAFLFSLFGDYFKKLIKKELLYEREVRVRVLGSWEKYFSEDTKQAIYALQEATSKHTKANLTFLLAYSGVVEMAEAVQAIVMKGLSSTDITPEIIKQHLYTADLPPVDLVVRTGGEPHFSSGFMMWDVADAQLYFTEKLWPDFSSEEFQKALIEYARRERRKGK
jgi:undecaprenyl diphosphate synthase